MRSKEKLKEQRRLLRLLKPAFTLVFVLPGFRLSFRLVAPAVGRRLVWLSVICDAFLVGGMLLISG
jgi:hypothetical protein